MAERLGVTEHHPVHGSFDLIGIDDDGGGQRCRSETENERDKKEKGFHKPHEDLRQIRAIWTEAWTSISFPLQEIRQDEMTS